MSADVPRDAPAVARPSWPAALGIACVALAASLMLQSPRLWVFLETRPNSTYWARGLEFVRQAEDPFSPRTAGDLALTWRLAPAAFAHVLGLRGCSAFLVPWVGLFVLLVIVAHLAWRHTGNRQISLWLTMLLGSTSAVFTVTGWLGINDAWYAALLILAAWHPRMAVALPAIAVGPWCDERFLLALPLVLWLRSQSASTVEWSRSVILAFTALMISVYVGIRWLDPLGLSAGETVEFLRRVLRELPQRLPWTGLGWFMGLRSAWVLVVLALVVCWKKGERRVDLAGAVFAGAALAGITLVASDSSRSPTMLLPLLFAGVIRSLAWFGPEATRRLLLALFVANSAMPAMHVTFRQADLINILPIEILRLWHI